MMLVACSGLAEAQFMPEKLSPLGEKIEAAVKGDIRSADEKARDAERKPRQTLEFFGLKEDMRVVELLPAGGYFTKILAPVLADRGELYVAIGTARAIEPMIRDVPAMAKVRVAPADAKIAPAAGQMGLFDLGDFSLGVTDVDLVLTFRNYHNLTPAARASLNRAVFGALKSGGRYGILDHTRRHNEPDSQENWRRMDPVRVIREVQAAGFLLEDFAGLHYTPDDELRYEVGRKSVAGNTDRFALRFRKP
ncbi:MAG: methyltransferase [Gammaproteobacteria bacterium]|nr:methyltransferase [Gammaproteobacteria bacterium]